jgi:serine protease Do
MAEMKAKPDLPPEAIDAVRDAYQTLANPARRGEYDETIAPPVTARAARSRAARPREAISTEEPRSFWSSPAIRYAVPVLILAIAFWAWKRHKPPLPQATIVSVTQVVTEESPPQAGDPAGSARNVTAPRSSGPLPPPTRNAEQVFSEASPSIVRILVSDSSGQVVKQGSGVVIARGRVITNCHVTQGASHVMVKSGANSRSANPYVSDEEFDLCSLDVFGLEAPSVTLGSVANMRTGQRVYAIGAPLGLELTISEGIVSSLREAAGSKVIQTTAPVSPGSSGGGLFSADGRLIGIVTSQVRNGQNLNFAMPVDWIAEMRTRGASGDGSGASLSGQ